MYDLVNMKQLAYAACHNNGLSKFPRSFMLTNSFKLSD